MPDFVTLSCPSCDAQLKISTDINRFVCRYCGCENIVNRNDDVISLSRFTKQLKQTQQTSSGVDRMASELAIARLRKEIEDNMIMIHKLEKGNDDLGCLSIISVPFYYIGGGLIFFSGIILLFSGWGESTIYLIGGILGGGLLVFIGTKINSYDETEKDKEAKPYRDAVAQKIKEMKFHKNIVDN